MSRMPNIVFRNMPASRWQASLVVDGSKHEIFSVDRKGFPVKALAGWTTIFFCLNTCKVKQISDH